MSSAPPAGHTVEPGPAEDFGCALRDGGASDIPRISPSATFGDEWLPGVDALQRQQLAENREHDGTDG
jgi:hypothetical protein